MKVYNLTRYRFFALIVSTVLIVGFWTYTLAFSGGFNFGIDLRPGLNLHVLVPGAGDEESVRAALADLGDTTPQVQTVGVNTETFLIRVVGDSDTEDFRELTVNKVSEQLNAEFEPVTILSEEYVSARFAGNLVTQTIWLTLLAMVLILVYVWIRFHLNYSVSAIAAVFHDILFLLGFIGAFRLEFSTATIAALLTIIGYSLNDTIVIFDRVRENTRIIKNMSFAGVIDHSLSQSLSRTLITSFTTLAAIVAILIFAVGTIRVFALSLAVGVLVGTFSSIFVAPSLLLAWHNSTARRAEAAAGPAETVERPSSTIVKFQKNAPEPIKQSAEEIAEATRKRAKAKAKKKKRKK